MHFSRKPDIGVLNSPQFSRSPAVSFDVESAAIGFNLAEPEMRFQLVEERLCQQDSLKFASYAEMRASTETKGISSNLSLTRRIEQTILHSPSLEPEIQTLLSTELDVLMELSYPIASTQKIYNRAINKGKSVSFCSNLPTSSDFVKFVLQKCGYNQFSRLKHSETQSEIRYPSQNGIKNTIFRHLPKPSSLPTHLIQGQIEQMLDDVSIRGMSALDEAAYSIGFQLMGPTIAGLLQSLKNVKGKIRFIGCGSHFLTAIATELAKDWNWIPECATDSEKATQVAILGQSADRVLIEIKENQTPAFFPLEHLHPTYLTIPPLEEWLREALAGDYSPIFQKGAEAFLKQFAHTTKGLFLPISPDYLISVWKSFVFRPNPELLEVIANGPLFPALRTHLSPLSALKDVKEGKWPNASFQIIRPGKRRLLKILAPARCQSIISLSR